MQNKIKNFEELADTPARRTVLEIMNAGLEAIDTEEVIKRSVSLSGNILSIKGQSFDLSKFGKIKVIGLGKPAPAAALALEKVLGKKIAEGAVVGLEKTETRIIESFVGSHPKPSLENVKAGKRIWEMANGSDENDLLIVIVSGGGSSLLIYPESEYVEGVKLYDAFLSSGKTITEWNTVRKHLSMLKGGGLVKAAYPATVLGLVFSDIPGDKFEDVASGPTYKDRTTIRDAQNIITENNLGEYELVETPKDEKYFAKVKNFVLVSAGTAIEGMEAKARELGFDAEIASTALYDEMPEALRKIFSRKKEGWVVLSAGEPRIKVTNPDGKGGRNLHLVLQAINMNLVDDDSVFASFASDGLDDSDYAGAIADKLTLEKIKEIGINAGDYLSRFDSYHFFQKTGDMIITGPTGSNVSDLMILFTPKNNH